MVAEMRGAQGGLGGTSQRHQAAVWHRDPGVGAKGPPHTLADFMQLDDVFEYNNEPGGDVARARAQAAEVQVAAQARERAATGAHFSKRPQRRRDEAGAVDGGAATHTDLVLVAFQDAMYAGGLTLKDTFSRMDTRQRGRVRLREFRDVVERLSKQLEHKVLPRRPPMSCLCVSVPHSLLAARCCYCCTAVWSCRGHAGPVVTWAGQRQSLSVRTAAVQAAQRGGPVPRRRSMRCRSCCRWWRGAGR